MSVSLASSHFFPLVPQGFFEDFYHHCPEAVQYVGHDLVATRQRLSVRELATTLVIGENALVDDNMSILHEVMPVGTGKESGALHSKVKKRVMIGAGALFGYEPEGG
jgi:hypothetical protein